MYYEEKTILGQQLKLASLAKLPNLQINLNYIFTIAGRLGFSKNHKDT